MSYLIYIQAEDDDSLPPSPAYPPSVPVYPPCLNKRSPAMKAANISCYSLRTQCYTDPEVAAHCIKTCSSSPSCPPCTDVAPPNGFSCEQQKSWGKCSADWMKVNSWCLKSCGRCV